MTSSETSTEEGLVPAGGDGAGPPAVGPGSGPPAPRPGLSPQAMKRLAVAAFVWLPAIGLVALLYGGKLTVGALFLGFAWVAFALATWQVGRAAMAFDLTPMDTLSLDQAGAIDDERRAELQREKKVLLKAIKEIEFDHQMGKLDDRDAADITATYRSRALDIMRLLDEDKSTDYGAIVEKELAKRLAKAGAAAKKALPAGESVLKPEVAVSSSSAAPGKCPECGTRNDEDAVFCKKCAVRLAP